MNVRTIKAKSVQETKDQIAQYKKEGFSPTLAIIFASVSFDLSSLCETFNENNIDLFGCSTAGEILNSEVFETSIVGLLFEINKDYYQLHCSEHQDNTIFEMGQTAGTFAKNCFPEPALLIASGGVTNDAQQIVFGLKSGVGEETPIFGGLAADELTLKGTFAFWQNGVTSDGIVTLVLDTEKITVEGLAISGWQAIGAINTITKAEGNIVYTINNEPALDVFIKYFGYFDSLEVKGRPISTISAQYPLQIIRDDGSIVLRSPLVGSEEDRTLILAGGVEEGDKFRFSISPGFEVIEQTVNEFGEFSKTSIAPEALILFSCKGRHAALGPLIEDEIKGIYDHWNTPMTGFFSYGEIGITKSGICDFHNETCSLVLLKEKKSMN